jgi:hypothetical protein
VHFGLGKVDKIDFVEVRWPSGIVERIQNLKVDTIHELKEGSGTLSQPAAVVTKKK